MATRFFECEGGAASYIAGDAVLIERMARSWQLLSGALELPEHEQPLTANQFLEIRKAFNRS